MMTGWAKMDVPKTEHEEELTTKPHFQRRGGPPKLA